MRLWHSHLSKGREIHVTMKMADDNSFYRYSKNDVNVNKESLSFKENKDYPLTAGTRGDVQYI